MVNSGNEFEKFKLTKRELEILHLLSLGLSNDEISKKLYISKSTLRSYLKNVYKKISVKGRGKAIYFANSYKDIIAKYVDEIYKKNSTPL